MNWQKLKKETEQLWEGIELYSDCYYQIQPMSKWLPGLSEFYIDMLEDDIGLPFPNSYRAMLSVMQGVDKPQVSIDSCEEEWRYERRFYQYPKDWELVQYYIEKIDRHKRAVHEALNSFNTMGIIGYIPIYAHRALVVFNDPSLSPVISVMGNDVVVYGNNLEEYFQHEFLRGNEY